MTMWWTVEQSHTLLGIAGATGGLCWLFEGVGIGLAAKGQARAIVTTGAMVMMGLGLAAMIAAVVALLSGQPSHVVQPPMIGGGIVTILGVVMAIVSQRRYAEADHRKMDAAALRQG